jgi:hypothetical protein
MMALNLNLLHEEFTQERQRKRDPLKLGIKGLIGIGAIFFLYYGWNAYRTIAIRSELGTARAEWQKVEPKVIAAQQRATELRRIIDNTKVLDGLIDDRYYWAPLLALISHCVAPNIQLTSFDGSTVDTDHTISVTLEGIAAAREPRAAAEEFRQLLNEQLEKNYGTVNVNFKNLEDLDTLVNLSGTPTASARFILNLSFDPRPDDPSRKAEKADKAESAKPAKPAKTSNDADQA